MSRDPERSPWFRLLLAVALTAAAYYIVDDPRIEPPAPALYQVRV